MLNFFDKEIPIASAFSKDEKILYTVTANGLLSKYEVESMKQIGEKNFMTEKTLDLFVVEKLIIIVNNQNLIVLQNDDKMENVMDRDFQY